MRNRIQQKMAGERGGNRQGGMCREYADDRGPDNCMRCKCQAPHSEFGPPKSVVYSAPSEIACRILLPATGFSTSRLAVNKLTSCGWGPQHEQKNRQRERGRAATSGLSICVAMSAEWHLRVDISVAQTLSRHAKALQFRASVLWLPPSTARGYRRFYSPSERSVCSHP